MFHHFDTDISGIALPEKFTFPFHYTPHKLSVLASKQLKGYLETKAELKKEISQGKMFGVMVVRNQNDEIGFIAAFSGILDGKNDLPYFVPPVYDLLDNNGFFRIEEKNISSINEKIREISESEEYLKMKKDIENLKKESISTLADAKLSMKDKKIEREKIRQTTSDKDVLDRLIKESQFEKAEYKRLEKRLKNEISIKEKALGQIDYELSLLKEERKERSATLQKKMFDRFIVFNAKGESKNLTSIFSDYAKKLPPAGAGECAAPKLLQYAYINNLKPVAMAEFWLGDSPKTEIRHSGFFYPACKHKCEPILDFMLSGLDVEPNPLTEKDNRNLDHFIIFEDDQILVVNKPSGMASVPGKNGKTSLYEKLEKNHSESRHLFVVHRLDMDTSGIIVFAKTKSAHKELQIQFRDHSIKKRYVAVVEGDVKDDEGEINLPICLNPDERPFQMVDYTFGKRAVTKYKVLCRNYKIKGSDNKEMPSKSVKESNSETLTKVLFSPLTGRTHQLRVHSSHHHGLDLPIKGDSLYGKKDKRLYLHAEYIEFTHPSTGKRVSFNVEPDF